jgi:hypothetical protein
MSAAHTRSISGLVYIYADRFMQAVERHAQNVALGATGIPCSSRPGRGGELNLYVDSRQLASHLLAASFWSLREQNLVDLTLEKSGWGIFSISSVGVHRKEQLPRPGLEGELLKALETWNGCKADMIITCWLGSRRQAADIQVLEMVQHELASLGYGETHEIKRGTISTFLTRFSARPDLEFRPYCDKIARLRDESESDIGRWEMFRRAERDLSTALLDECETGVGLGSDGGD